MSSQVKKPSLFKRNWADFAAEMGGKRSYWQALSCQEELYHEYDRLLKDVVKNRQSTVLDLGAGRLFYRDLIKSHTDHYISIDFQKTHPELDHIGTASDTHLKDGSCNVVFCVQVLEHVPDPAESFQEIHRILKKGGVAIIAVPFLMYLHNEPYDFFRYTKHALKMFSEKTQFTLLELKEVGGLFGFVGAITAMCLIGSTWHIPGLKWVFFGLNLVLQKMYGVLDRITKNQKIFPSNYLLVLKK